MKFCSCPLPAPSLRLRPGARYKSKELSVDSYCGRVPHAPPTSKLRISPGSHSATTSNGRQQISQSVVNRWDATLVSIIKSNCWPQNGHWIDSDTCTCPTYQLLARAQNSICRTSAAAAESTPVQRLA